MINYTQISNQCYFQYFEKTNNLIEVQDFVYDCKLYFNSVPKLKQKISITTISIS